MAVPHVSLLLDSADLVRFARIRVGPDLLARAQVRRVTDEEARRNYGITFKGDASGIVFPYSAPLAGDRLTARLRRDNPEKDAEGKAQNKYICPFGDNRHLYFAPDAGEWLRDVTLPIVFVESEKATLALTALAVRIGKPILVVGTGGCWGWKGKTGIESGPNGERMETRGPLADFSLLALEGRGVYIAFDANVATNAKVRQARLALARMLTDWGAKVHYVDLPELDGVNGPDDLIAVKGDEVMLELLRLARPLAAKATSDTGARKHRVAGFTIVGPLGTVQWPDPAAPEAYHGLAGDIVRTIEPHSEADPIALLIQALLCFGNVVGRTAHFVAESIEHFTNLFAVLVGATSVARKGSSWAQIIRLFRAVDKEWAAKRVQHGLSSGEGLIWAVHDPITKTDSDKDGNCEEKVVDPGVSDKRLFVFEGEFSSPLRMMARDGNTLSVMIRQAWDTGHLQSMTKNSPAVATGALISIVGHITRDELRRELGATEMGNGFANRFLWTCVTRSKELPEGGSLTEAELAPLVDRLRDAVQFAQAVGETRRHDSLKKMWASAYHELTAGKPGLLGAVTSRAAPQTMRLACLYALLDKSPVVKSEHLLAALALWEYCQASAKFIFGDALGDPTADAILQALRRAPTGLDRTAISAVFGRHQKADQISRGLTALQEHGLATFTQLKDGVGRPREVWLAVGNTREISELSERASPTETGYFA